jgi:hypothetical protein
MTQRAADPKPATGGRARTKRYRASHRRIDYCPSAASLAIIEVGLAAKLNNCLAGVIDDLILAGQSAVTGNAPADTPTPA